MDAVFSTSFEFIMGMILSLTIDCLGKFGNYHQVGLNEFHTEFQFYCFLTYFLWKKTKLPNLYLFGFDEVVI